MPFVTSPEIKKALLAAGFELYRTRGDEVQVADRVRDNLIMDSGVSVRGGLGLRVRFVVRAQRSDFPSDAVPTLFERARSLGAGARDRGYVELTTQSSPIRDPVDPSHVLDTWYEVFFEKGVATLLEAIEEVRFVLGLEKAVRSLPPAAEGPRDTDT